MTSITPSEADRLQRAWARLEHEIETSARRSRMRRDAGRGRIRRALRRLLHRPRHP
jgi:hypothetical protein